jgi:mono/diheme cytochrome c family protein
MTDRLLARAFLVGFLAGAVGCGAKDAAPPAPPAAAAVAGGDLTPFQLEHGIGPITEVLNLGPVSHEMAEAGEKLFETKCSACHKMVDKYVGPPLGEVTTRRTPEFIMNQILNPDGMYTRHPVVKQLLGEYMTQMPNQGLTQDEARKVLEYLRTQSHATAGS